MDRLHDPAKINKGLIFANKKSNNGYVSHIANNNNWREAV